MLCFLQNKFVSLFIYLWMITSLTTGQRTYSLDDCDKIQKNDSVDMKTLKLSNSALCIAMPFQRIYNITIEFTVLMDNFDVTVSLC